MNTIRAILAFLITVAVIWAGAALMQQVSNSESKAWAYALPLVFFGYITVFLAAKAYFDSVIASRELCESEGFSLIFSGPGLASVLLGQSSSSRMVIEDVGEPVESDVYQLIAVDLGQQRMAPAGGLSPRWVGRSFRRRNPAAGFSVSSTRVVFR